MFIEIAITYIITYTLHFSITIENEINKKNIIITIVFAEFWYGHLYEKIINYIKKTSKIK